MTFLRLVPMLCCLLLPLQGLAQAQPSEEPLAPSTPPPLVPAPGAPQQGDPQEEPRGELIPPSEHATRGSGSAAGRVPFGIFLGTLGGAVSAIPGALLGAGICSDRCGPDGGLLLGSVLGGVGWILGSAATINLSGDWQGGRGGFWPTALGALLGALGGIGAAVATRGESLVGFVATILGPSVGGVIAYEISHARNTPAAAAAPVASGPRVVPVLAVSPRGGFIGGLAGSF